MITSALRQKVQGAGKIAKQIFMVVVLCTNGDKAPRKKTQAPNASTNGDASRVGHQGKGSQAGM